MLPERLHLHGFDTESALLVQFFRFIAEKEPVAAHLHFHGHAGLLFFGDAAGLHAPLQPQRLRRFLAVRLRVAL